MSVIPSSERMKDQLLLLDLLTLNHLLCSPFFLLNSPVTSQLLFTTAFITSASRINLILILLFFQTFQPHRNLSQLPNFAYSVALACFQFNRKHGESKRADELVSGGFFFFRYIFYILCKRLSILHCRAVVRSQNFSMNCVRQFYWLYQSKP